MSQREMRAPGVYHEPRHRLESPLGLIETGVPAFLGMALRGPLDVPIPVYGFDEFKKRFGQGVPGSYLSDQVFGYFANGGRRCYIVRIAHQRGGDGELATCASRTLLDSEGRPSLRIVAANEGTWGNSTEIEVRLPEAKVQTYITSDIEKGDSKADVKSARGFERGTLIRIFDRKGNVQYGTLTAVENRVLRWRNEDAVEGTFKTSDLVHIEPVVFDLLVRERGKSEVFRGLSLAPGSERFPTRVAAESSDLVRIEVIASDIPVAERLPASVGPVALSGGLDGLDDITPEDFIGMNEGPDNRVGLCSLEANDEIDLIVASDLIACSENSSGFSEVRDVKVVQQAIVSHCEKLSDRFAILDFPQELGQDDALTWRLQYDSKFAAFYFPWIGVNTSTGIRWIPPSGHVAGVYSRCDGEDGPHRAAANEVVQGAVLLAHSLDEEELGYLNSHSVNSLIKLPSRGIRIWGARTVSSSRDWRYIPVRRVFNAIRRSLYLGTQWVVFEPHSPSLWRRLEDQIKFFLQGLYERGFFAGENTEAAFFVKCNNETNPPERRAAGQLVVEIGLAPARPAEFITFVLEHQLPEAGAG
jgi:hypothetical protein